MNSVPSCTEAEVRENSKHKYGTGFKFIGIWASTPQEGAGGLRGGVFKIFCELEKKISLLLYPRLFFYQSFSSLFLISKSFLYLVW
jgi:hypothetical protein